MKKYVLTETKKEWFGITLYQIKAVRSFGNVKEGDLGGWIEKEENLDHEGDAWVSGNALVLGNAQVSGDARIETKKHIFWASFVGSENGTLTAYTIKSGEIEVTRGCFRGLLNEFEDAVNNRHGNNQYGEEYRALIQYIRLRFRGVKGSIQGVNA